MKTTNFRSIIKDVAKNWEIKTGVANAFVDELVSAIKKSTMEGNSIIIRKFGSFNRLHRKPRNYKSPNWSGTSKPYTTLSFRASKQVRFG